MKTQSFEEELVHAFYEWHGDKPLVGVVLLVILFIIPALIVCVIFPAEEIGKMLGVTVGILVVLLRLIGIPLCHAYAKHSPRHRRRVLHRKGVH
jgi:hypothetical protein